MIKPALRDKSLAGLSWTINSKICHKLNSVLSERPLMILMATNITSHGNPRPKSRSKISTLKNIASTLWAKNAKTPSFTTPRPQAFDFRSSFGKWNKYNTPQHTPTETETRLNTMNPSMIYSTNLA